MNPMKWIYNLSREQFDHFSNGGGARLRRHARRKNFGDGTSVFVEGAWTYARLVPRKASQ